MEKIMKFFTLILLILLSSCNKEEVIDNGNDETNNTDQLTLDTVDFRVLVYIDKPSVESHLGGSERIVRQKMDKLFSDVTKYWNKSANAKLDFYYRYVLADMKVYDCGSNDNSLNNEIYNEPIDFSKYDVTVLFDAKQDNDNDRGSGGAHGGGADYRSVITVIAGDTPKNIFDEATRNTLTHELGHYRGVTDLYQYIIEENDNPVSHQKFEAITCIMNWAAAGVWSDYAIACMNKAGTVKQIGKKYPNFFDSLYPDKLQFHVTLNNEPLKGAIVELYASRAGNSEHNRDIWPQVFVSGITDNSGNWGLNDLKNYFIPDKNKHPEIQIPPSLAYGRCFGFLAKIKNGNKEQFVWLPEPEVQMVTFDNKDTYTVNVAF